MEALDLLSHHGLTVTVDGGDLLVKPSNRLTDELRNYIREHKPELIEVVKSWAALADAIEGCCNARGDADANRQALLNDCRRESANDWPWWTNYFNCEAARWTH